MKNIFKIASLLAAAVVLFSCEKDMPVGDLQLNVDKVKILSDGRDYVSFVVLWQETDVTSNVEINAENIVTGQSFTLEEPRFATTEEGVYKFSVEYNGDTVSKLLIAKASVTDPNEDISKVLKMTVDRSVIQADGRDCAVLKVCLDGFDISSKSEIYSEEDKLLNLENGKFTTNTVGDYKFYANFGTMSTYDKNASDEGLITVKAIGQAIPQVLDDPQKENTSFVHRTFLTQFTGTGCGYCPYMIRTLRQIAVDNVIPEKAVLAAVHSYGSGDPAYIPYPKVSNYPYLTLDLVQGFSSSQTADVLKNLVNERTTSAAKAGISVSPAYYASDAMLVVTVAVKAAVAGSFNVGAWLLEDGIYGAQNDYDNIGDDTYDIHNNCVRIADSKFQHVKKETWFGYELGELSAGSVAEKTFVMKIDKKWVVENLHLAVFVSYDDADGYAVCNAVDVPIDAPTPFEYVK